MAKAKHDGLSIDSNREVLLDFINSQEHDIHLLLKNDGKDLKMTVEAGEPELGAGRRQRRTVTAPNAYLSVEVLVPQGLSFFQEREFIIKTFQERLQTIDDYRKKLNRFKPTLD
jgi:hypothetical protein